MTVMSIAGEPTLVAAYTCSPGADSAQGLEGWAHIAAKTVGELGWGSAPNALVSFGQGDAEYALAGQFQPFGGFADCRRPAWRCRAGPG
jgi:hypothetical protein